MPLGHDPDTFCPTPRRGRLQVLDLDGIQMVHVDYCECTQSWVDGASFSAPISFHQLW